MVERIQNGNFSQSTGGTDMDPVSWATNETNENQVLAVNGRMNFNGGGTAAGSSIEQDIPGVLLGKEVNFSLDYLENGSGGDPSILVEILDGNGDVIFSQSATLAGTTVATTFTSVTDSYTVRITDTSTGNLSGHDVQIDNVSFDVACFARGTLIQTPNGTVKIETIEVGQMISTADHGEQPVRWVGQRKLDQVDLAQSPNLIPIKISKGALGVETPSSDLAVSPQHRVLLRSKIVNRMMGTNEILVAAKKLLDQSGISVMCGVSHVEYYHLLLDNHEVIYANGAASESLFCGPMAMNTLGKDAVSEIRQLFPEIDLSGENPKQTRPFGRGKKLQQLISRHTRNRKPLVEDMTSAF